MKLKSKTVLIILATSMLGACSIFDAQMGKSVNGNTTSQLVDPYAGFHESVATMDGQKAEKLLKEYRTEKAKAPTEKLLQDIGD